MEQTVPLRGTPLRVAAEDGFFDQSTQHGTFKYATITYPDHTTGKDFVITGDEATVDLPTDLALLKGHVALTTPQGQKVTGDELRLNLRTREWSLTAAQTEFTPELLQHGVLGSIYAQGATITGEQGHVRLENTSYTTCELAHPHYFFRAKSVDIYPGDKMIVRRATLYALGHRLFTLPTLVFPLRERAEHRYPIVPEVGQSEAEGYFIKSAYQYALKGRDLGLLKLDLMSKRGVGTGVQQAYRLAGGAGTLLLYNLIPLAGVAAERSGHLQHSQQFGNIRADFTGDFRQSDYQYAVADGTSTTTIGTGLNLARQVQGMNTILTLRQDQTTGAGTFSTLTSSLNHTQQFGHGLSGNFGADYITSSSGGTTGSSVVSSQVKSRIELKEHQRLYDLTLTANDTTDLSSGAGRVPTGLQRQPELALQTDTAHFQGGFFAHTLPLRLLLSFGRFHEEPRAVDTERALMQFELNNRIIEKGIQRLTLTDMFRQSFYGDGGAEYVFGGTNRYTLQLGRYAEFNLSHIFQRPEGFTPFRFDFPYKQNRVESELLFVRGERFDIGFRTGYDFRATEQFHWQNLTMRLRWLPTRNTLFFLGTSYNPNPFGLPSGVSLPQSHLQTVISQFRIRIPDGLKLDIGARYDPAHSGFTAAKLGIDTPIGRKWHFAGLFGYDGFSRFNDFMIVRDLHCWELSLVRMDHRDWRNEQGWRINLTIKAFPVFQNYGVGESGQPLDTGVGDVF